MDTDVNRLVGGRRRIRAGAAPGGRQRRRRAGIGLLATLASLLMAAGLLLAGTAAAETVTIGTPTADFGPTGSVESSSGCNNCTQYQLSTQNPLAVETVPADGVITGWRVSGGGTLTLEVLRPGADGTLSNVGGSGGQTASSGTGIPTQPVHIPVLEGDSIGVHLSGSSPKVFNTGSASDGTFGQVSPDVPATPNILSGLISLNADVALTPVVSSISATSGSTGGGTVTTITGSYLDGSTSVRFGAVPASSFTVVSSTEILASAPAQSAGTVDVTVGGPGGSSPTTPADRFTYSAPAGQHDAGGGQSPSGPETPIDTGPGLLLSPLSLSASYFLAAKSGAAIAKTATGTTLTYTLSAPATTTLIIQSVLPGRLLPANSTGVRTCVAPNRATLPVKLPKCSRYVSLTPHLTHTGPSGRNTVRLTGRLSGHALAPGPYRLLATATSTATPSLVSAPVTHAFHVLAPKTSSKTTTRPKAHAALPTTGPGAAAAPTG